MVEALVDAGDGTRVCHQHILLLCKLHQLKMVLQPLLEDLVSGVHRSNVGGDTTKRATNASGCKYYRVSVGGLFNMADSENTNCQRRKEERKESRRSRGTNHHKAQ